MSSRGWFHPCSAVRGFLLAPTDRALRDSRLVQPIVAVDTRHRTDIDGLRAIAILSVLGFHAFERLFPGGFVGVDIFFVISGYLISGILLRALRQNTFSFTNFYARRIKRIFPALAVVLWATFVAGWYLLLPDEYERLAKEIASGAGFVANITFWKESGYFDQPSRLKPLLHLWSLGIEEQFYLIWPLLLFLAWKRKINALAAILGIFLVSFVLNVVRVRAHEVSTFYLLITRFWELALGGAYACWEIMRTDRAAAGEHAVPSRLPGESDIPAGVRCHVGATVGLLLLLWSALYLKSTMAFPGWWALAPTLGSLLLIAAGPHAWVNRHLLAIRPMVFIGLISYPLYLWHWPLLSLHGIVSSGRTSSAVRIALLFAAGILAWLTYHFVERPIRSGSSMRAAVPLVALVAAIGAIGFLGYRGALSPRSAAYRVDKITAASNGVAFLGPRLQAMDPNDIPLLRQGTNSKTVLFIGDSFIEQYYPRIDWLLQAHPQSAESVVFASSGGCLLIRGVFEDHHRSCNNLRVRAERFADDPNVNAIVIGANWLGYFVSMDRRYSYYFEDYRSKRVSLLDPRGAALALDQLRLMIGRFKARGKEVYLVLQSPNDDALNPRGLIESRWGRDSFKINTASLAKDALTRPMQPIDALLRNIAGLSGARVIDPVDDLCGAYCPVITQDGVPIYRDEGHLNPEYVRTRVRYLDSVVMGGPGPI